jgi:hypothetical protein
MGRLARVISFARTAVSGKKVTDVKSDLGGGDVLNGQHFAPVGDDSMPLPDDYVALIPLARQRGAAAVGYLDPKANQTAGAGEKRIYSRDGSGAQVAQVWLRADGTVVVNNGAGMITMAPAGTINLNGVEIDPSGNISVPGDADITGDVTAASVTADEIEAVVSLIAAGLELVLHTHLAGVPPGNTGPNQ